MKRSNFLLLILLLVGAMFVGGYLVAIGWALIKIMIGLLGIGLFVGGFYVGRWTKR